MHLYGLKMIKKIAFKSCFQVETLEPDLTFLLSEKESILLRGHPYFQLAPFLAKPLYSLDEIIDKVGTDSPEEYWLYALHRLEKRGVLEEIDPSIPQEISAFYHSLGISPQIALSRLSSSKVFVRALGNLDLQPFVSVLHSFGVEVTNSESIADFSIVVAQDYLQEELEEMNRIATQKNHPWMLLKPQGCEIWIGPIFDTKHTGCWQCLASRLKRNRLEESYIARKKQQNIRPLFIPSHPAIADLGFKLASVEIVKHIVLQKSPSLLGKMISYDVADMKMQEHVLMKRPQCQCCGNPLSGLEEWEQPIVPSSVIKSGYQDGGARIRSADETFTKYSHHISRITGVVEALESCVLNSSTTIHAFTAGHNFAVSNEYRGVFPNNPRSGSGGKGKSLLQAKVSALCEALERHSGLFEGNEIRKRTSYQKIKEEAIHPDSCLLFSEKQYAVRQQNNLKAHSFHRIPHPFCEEQEIEWSPVWSLTCQKQKFLPSAYCYFSYPHISESHFCYGDSNGNASGNCLEEAILHGFCELIERDSAAIWWYNRLKRPSVDLSSFKDPFFQQILSDYKGIGREVWVLDLTFDLQVPVFVALSKKIEGAQEIVFGFGCDLNAQVAIARALTEMNQILCFMPPVHAEKPTIPRIEDSIDYDIAHDWMLNATLQNQPYLQGTIPCKAAADYPDLSCKDLSEEILFCRKVVEKAGMEFLVLNQTRQDIGLNVVKVIVPGLRHFWPRFAPGRLYDVPVTLGYFESPLREEEVNPVPIFI